MLRSSSVVLTVHFANVVYALQIQFSGRKLATEGRGWKVLHYVDVQAAIIICFASYYMLMVLYEPCVAVPAWTFKAS